MKGFLLPNRMLPYLPFIGACKSDIHVHVAFQGPLRLKVNGKCLFKAIFGTV